MSEVLYSISLDKLIKEQAFEEVYMPVPASQIMITNREVTRPGLALAGFLTVFEPSRIQVIGRAEMQYLFEIGKDVADARLEAFFAQKPVAVIITTNFEIGEEILTHAQKYGVPILRTKEKTSPTMASLIASLNTHLANRITQHGVLVEVYGEGVLILGESGIGKSETAIALVERGHRLIADDAVEIKRVSAKALVGSAPSLIKHYVELDKRGSAAHECFCRNSLDFNGIVGNKTVSAFNKRNGSFTLADTALTENENTLTKHLNQNSVLSNSVCKVCVKGSDKARHCG